MEAIDNQEVVTRAQARVTHMGEGVETQIAEDGDLVMRETAPGTDLTTARENEPAIDVHRDDGEDIRLSHHPRTLLMTGIPNSLYWTTTTVGGVRETNAHVTPELSTRGSNSGESVRESKKWSDRTSSTQ